MQVVEIKSEGLAREIEVTIPATEISVHVDRHLVRVGQNVKIPGFRPGKVPMELLRKRYGKAVLGDVLESAVNDSTTKIIKEKGLRPALQPKIEVKSFDDGKDLTYLMAFEILPEFEIADLKAVSVEKPVAKVADVAIDETLARIAEHKKASDLAPEGHAAKKGDILVITFHGRTVADGKEHPGMHSHDFHLELGSGRFIEGFEDQLIGVKKGESRTVKVTFPEKYQASELAGQAAEFDVDVEEIRIPKKAEIDEEFAKSMGMPDVAALRKAVSEQLSAEYERMSRMKLKRSLLDALDELHDFPIPEGMLNLEYETILKQIEEERKRGPKEEAEGDLSDEERDELMGIAERRVRLGLVLAEIGNRNAISVGDQELQRAVIEEARRYPGQERQVFEFYQKNRQAVEALRAPLFEEKVVDFILELAKVAETEVTPENLAEEDERPAPKSRQGTKKSGVGKAAGKESSASAKKTDCDEKPAAKAKATKKSDDSGDKKADAEKKKPAAKKKEK